MVQALMLLGIYALLPMIVVLFRYSLSMMVVRAMAIFTIKFWNVLWYLAMWVDQNLIQSMYRTSTSSRRSLRTPASTMPNACCSI